MELTNENIKLEIFRNRSDMEAQISLPDGTVINRIPVKWKSREGKLDYLSYSKIQAYEQCPACFYHEYISEETAHIDNANYFTKFGSIMHEVAEIVVRTYRDNGIVLNVEQTLQEVCKHYDLKGVETYEEMRNLIVGYFKTNPVDQRKDKAVLIEKEWRGELGGCTFGLVIDYAGVKIKNPKIGLLRDYKTNRMPFNTAELQSSLQLRLYQIVLRRHLMPEVERWISGYDLFYYGWQQTKEFTEDDLKSAEEYVNIIYNQIINDNVWEHNLNNFCCYRECRHTCPEYQKAIKDGDVPSVQYFNRDDTDWSEIDAERCRMTALEKAAQGRKRELEDMERYHVEELMRNGKPPLIIDGQELMLYSSSNPHYRYEDVYRVLLAANRLDLLNGFLTIKDSKAFARLCNAQDTNLKMQLAACVSNSYSTPYITKKRS